MALILEPLPDAEYAGWREGVIARRVASPRSRGVSEAVAVRRAREVIDRHLPPLGPPAGTEVLAVAADGRRAGTFFLLPQGGSVHLGDLQLADPADAATVRELVVRRLHSRAALSLGVGVTTGDPAGEAFVDADGFDVVATQMQLELELELAAAPTPGDSERVTVRPMTAEEISAYLARAVTTFAEETMAAEPTLTLEAALESSRELHDQILPQGSDTPGHDFLVALDGVDGRRTGMTWLFHEDRAGFVYDVEVDEAERGKGFGRALMEAAAAHARGLGMDVLGLNVFGHNHVAHALYESLGYDVVDRSYVLALAPSERGSSPA